MRIADRLYINQRDLERSKELVKELAKMSAELPKIKIKEDAAKEEYWLIKEALRKAHTLFSDNIKELEAEERATAYKVQAPRHDFGVRCDKLKEELEVLTLPVCHEIIELLQRELKDTGSVEWVRRLGAEKRLVDKGGDVETEFKVTSLETNSEAIAKARDMLMEFIGRCRSNLRDNSIDQIVKETQTFEDKYNKIDFAKGEKIEVSQSAIRDLRETGKML